MASAAAESSHLEAEALFDSVGPAYEDAFATCTEQYDSIQWLLKNLPPQASILDIGCGTGRPVCSSLAAAGHDVLGVDVSNAMLTAAIRNVPQAKFEKANIKTFSPPGGSTYDAITVYFSLLASLSQQDIKDIFAKVFTWLKHNGIFVFATVPVSGNHVEMSWLGRPVVVSSLSSEEILESLKATGFVILQVQNSKFYPQAVKAGICEEKDVWEEDHIFVYAKKQ